MGTRKPIELSLDNLTQEHIDKAMPNAGACTYSSPCILGAMMPPSLIRRLKKTSEGGMVYDFQGINALSSANFVKFSGGDAELKKAARIQKAFDSLGYMSITSRERQNALRVLRRALPGLKISQVK